MSFDAVKASEVANTLKAGAIDEILAHAQRTYPSECCGFILESGSTQPAQNIIDTLGIRSLTSKNSFMIDSLSWNIASNRESPIIGIYHSHANGDAAMSPMDEQYLVWPELCYVVLGIIDRNLIAARLHWWENGQVQYTDLLSP